MTIELAKRLSADEVISKLGRYTGFWKDVFERAEKEQASDIHVYSLFDGLQVRLRVNGILRIIAREENNSAANELIVTIKQVANLDTGTRRIRQDDSFALKLTKSTYRVTLGPGGGDGECLVFRIIKDEEIPSIKSIGLSEQALSDMRGAYNQNQGFFLVTGPTGSGKSTTLQACLMDIDRESKGVITAEDPVERKLKNVYHQKITPEYTWKEAIKHALRADPDIILIGEMRDEESAHLAIEAVQTGHLVMSTLHTQSVVKTIDRLLLMGIKPYEIADSILFISAQRLGPKLCDSCKIPDGDYYIRNLKGCEKCNRGYKGRIPFVEYIVTPDRKSLLDFDKEAIDSQLSQRLSTEILKAVQSGSFDHQVYNSMVKHNSI